MSTSRSSRFKERDDEYRPHRSHAHGKKRRRSPGFDLEDHDNHSSYKDKDRLSRESSRRDALAGFRAEISEDEAHHRISRHYDEPAFSSASHHRGHGKETYNDHELHHRDHNRSRSYKENRRNSDRHGSEHMSLRDCVKDLSRDHGSSHDRETYESRHRRQLTPDETEYSRSSKPSEDRSSRFEKYLQGHDQEEPRGRSISRSSPTRSYSKSPSSQSTSASSDSRHHSYRRKRRRSRSRSPLKGRKDDRNRKHKRSSSRRRDRSESKRSILTGKKIKLKVKKERGDDERDANRQELLKFLNSAYE